MHIYRCLNIQNIYIYIYIYGNSFKYIHICVSICLYVKHVIYV